MQYLAFDVGGTGIKHALIDEEYRITAKGTVPSNGIASTPEFIETLGGIHDRYAADVAGIAISSCGEVDPATGHMLSGGALVFNSGINMIDLVNARCGTRVTVENDANCALLAEYRDGALAGCTNAVLLTLGTGIGGALLLNERLYRGSHFHSGNASFTMTTLHEGYAMNRLLAMVNGAGALADDVSARKGLDRSSLDGPAVFDLVARGDADADTVLQEFAERLGRFIYNVQVLLDVEAFALGGGISAQPELIERVRRVVDDLFDGAFIPLPRPRVSACRHYNDANLRGALYHHLHATTD